jgi:hypothetical protein
VVVCPEHAIISGDMDDSDTEISQLLSREQTTVRKPEKGTIPNLYYIEGDAYSLTPTAAEPGKTPCGAPRPTESVTSPNTPNAWPGREKIW